MYICRYHVNHKDRYLNVCAHFPGKLCRHVYVYLLSQVHNIGADFELNIYICMYVCVLIRVGYQGLLPTQTVRMYVCMYVCITHIQSMHYGMHVCMYACMHVFIHTYIHAYMHASAYWFTEVELHICMDVITCTYTHLYA